MFKRIIRKVVIWLLKTANIENVVMPSVNGSCSVVKDGKFLYLTMPDGTIIPKQKDFILSNNVEERGLCSVQITVFIPLSGPHKK